MKDAEKQLIKTLLKLTGGKPYVAGRAIEFSEDKRFYFYLDKWLRKGWWEYGVTLRSGWFTPEGIEHFKTII